MPTPVDPALLNTARCRTLLEDRIRADGHQACPLCGEAAFWQRKWRNRTSADDATLLARHMMLHYPDEADECEEAWHANAALHGLKLFPADEYDMGIALIDADRGFDEWLWTWLADNAASVHAAGFTCIVREEQREGLTLKRRIGYVDAALYRILRDAAVGLGSATREWGAFAQGVLDEAGATSEASAS